jgi:hypothetical protein
MSASISDIVLRLARRELESGPAPVVDPLATWPEQVRPNEPQGLPYRAVPSLRSPDEEQNAATELPPDAPVPVSEQPQLSPAPTPPAAAPSPAPPAALSSPPVVAVSSSSRREDRGSKIENDEPSLSSLPSLFSPPSSLFFPSSPPLAPHPRLQINDADANAPSTATVSSPITGAFRSSSPGHPQATGPGNEPCTGPAGTPKSSSGESGTDRLSESVADQSRQLEQLSHDLDSSLTRLFATQLETLDNLRQRLDEQERLWLEQQAVRRAGA